MKNLIRAAAAASLATLGLLSLLAHADNGRAMRVILPVSAGSGVDTIMRAAAPALSKALGDQAVVIENLPGAGGITGTAAIVKAAPDGQTIGVVSNNYSVNPSVYKKMPYDSLADITPITVLGSTPLMSCFSGAPTCHPPCQSKCLTKTSAVWNTSTSH